MRSDIPGKFIGLLIAFVLTVIMPFVTVSVHNEMSDRRLIISDVCDFIDQVVDSRTVDEAMIRDLNLSLASYGVTVDYEIHWYSRTINPDPLNKGQYVTTYIENHDASYENMKFQKGDKIAVHFYTVGYSSSTAVARNITGLFIGDLDRTITARIR